MKQKALEWSGPGFRCSSCISEPPETHDNLPWGMIILPSEPAMNAAGRTSDHPFRDLRAASRARRRTKRYPERIYSGNKRRRSDKPQTTRASRRRDPHEHIANREWEEDWCAEWAHKTDLEFMDEIVAYERHGKNAHYFEQWTGKEEVIIGEPFTIWAQRRISEMRSVKETRLLTKLSHTEAQKHLKPQKHTLFSGRGVRTTTLFAPPGDYNRPPPTAPPFTPSTIYTTLPTNHDDVYAHALLRSYLTPNKYFLMHCKRTGQPPFPSIQGFQWFGEYTWQWHRNMSGCWVLGYGDACSGAAFPCSCCCCNFMTGYGQCHCKEFGVGTVWEVPAPEERQECALVEWACEELREGLWEEERRGEKRDREVQRRAEEHCRSREANFWGHEDEYLRLLAKEDGWELLSPTVSSQWSVISEMEVETG